MKKGLILTMTALLLLAGIAVAQPGGKAPGVCDGDGPHGMRGRGANGPGMGGGQGGPMGVLGMADDLGLTDAQVTAIEDMMDGFRIQMIDHRAEVQKAEIKLRSLQRDNASESAVGAAIDDLSRLQAQGQKMRYSQHQKVRAQLTAEQQQKLDQLRRQRPGRGQGDGMGRGQGKRGGRGAGGMGCKFGTNDLNNNG